MFFVQQNKRRKLTKHYQFMVLVLMVYGRFDFKPFNCSKSIFYAQVFNPYAKKLTRSETNSFAL